VDVMQLARWRDAALILLTLEALLLGVPLLIALYQGLRGLAWLQERVIPILFDLRVYVEKVKEITVRITSSVAAALIWLHSVLTGLRRVLDNLCWR